MRNRDCHPPGNQSGGKMGRFDLHSLKLLHSLNVLSALLVGVSGEQRPSARKREGQPRASPAVEWVSALASSPKFNNQVTWAG
jgi:hypothetical protein